MQTIRNLRFETSYDGTHFKGWQLQPGLPTIQGALEAAIGSLEGSPVHVIGSGRTDAGVHALAQVAAVKLTNPISTVNFRRAVNRLLPPSIRVVNVCEALPTFHPRFDARRKTYRYRIFRAEVCSPFEFRYVCHHPYSLDEDAMFASAALIEGEHDFKAFAAPDEKDALEQSKVRRVFSSSLTRDSAHLTYTVTGSGFLKHMVRNIVGILFEVGKRNLAQDDVLARLQPGSLIRAGPTAPAKGLFLVSVDYS